MPTIFTHIAVPLALSSFSKEEKNLLLTGIFFSILPDADVVSFYFGISYDSFWGHRGFSHSIAFSFILSLVVSLFWKNKYKAFFFLFMAILSHGVLDGLTNGGLGVAYFSPLDNQRYFFPWRPISVSPIGGNFFSQRGIQTIVSEIQWIWLPTAFAISSFYGLNRWKMK